MVSWEPVSTDAITLTFDTAPSSNEYVVYIAGGVAIVGGGGGGGSAVNRSYLLSGSRDLSTTSWTRVGGGYLAAGTYNYQVVGDSGMSYRVWDYSGATGIATGTIPDMPSPSIGSFQLVSATALEVHGKGTGSLLSVLCDKV
jgi:hypothetical protein